jgi:hypothetical protein
LPSSDSEEEFQQVQFKKYTTAGQLLHRRVLPSQYKYRGSERVGVKITKLGIKDTFTALGLHLESKLHFPHDLSSNFSWRCFG